MLFEKEIVISTHSLELHPIALRRSCDSTSLAFQTTAELPDLANFIGQPRAYRGLELGSEVTGLGYHIYVMGLPTSGRTTLSREYLEQKAAALPTPNDLCYVNNFADPHQRCHDHQRLLGGRYGREKPLNLSASLTFEQSYDGVEGDSASAAELFTLLSALTGIPLRQDLAVTCSMNQHGLIQPIGGVNEKAEGFFAVCKEKGLTGTQGVVIPASNVRNLMLRDEVVQAVAESKFHLWAIKTVDEGLEIFTGMDAGERGKNGKYPEGSFNRAVVEKLEVFAEVVKEKKEGDGGEKDEK